jgi:hypothetical protein
MKIARLIIVCASSRARVKLMQDRTHALKAIIPGADGREVKSLLGVENLWRWMQSSANGSLS